MTSDITQTDHISDYGIETIYRRIETERQRGPDYEDSLEDRDDSAPENMAVALTIMAAMFEEGTVAELDGEPVLYGMVNAVNRQLGRLHRDHQDACSLLQDLVGQEDFSEVGAVRLEQAQARAHQLDQRIEHLEDIRDFAIGGYEEATGNTWMPPKGSAPSLQGPTKSTIDAATYLRQRRARELAATAPTGPLIAVMGPRDFASDDTIAATLDNVLTLHPDMVLVHGADRQSAIDTTAAKWARQNDVHQVSMDPPDYTKHKRAAPFKRNDDMIALGLKAVVIFEIAAAPKHGISQNLAQKATEKRIPVRRVKI